MQERIRHIQTLMSLGKWLGYPSCEMLARDWGCAVQTVRNYSTHASAGLRIAIEESDDLRVEIAHGIRLILAKALEKGELRTAAAAIQTMIGAANLFPDAKDTNAELIKRETAKLRAAEKAASSRSEVTRTIEIVLPPDPDDAPAGEDT